MTQRTARQRRPEDTQGSRQLPIACHGAIKFLPRANRLTNENNFFVCDSGCLTRVNGAVLDGKRGYRGADGFIQILDHEPIPLCRSCLREAKKALAEIEENIVEST